MIEQNARREAETELRVLGEKDGASFQVIVLVRLVQTATLSLDDSMWSGFDRPPILLFLLIRC